ncbi:UNVERIFIED_CONTAM: putative late blight resistance proteinR1A-4 [Sesamum angustifolium]|uniref:Late blight resistance proteinR1A-4 n=1 Tax=Sesamum angustifolium TaxID=2727405 RepID=A0AAW2LKC2_9LAMI
MAVAAYAASVSLLHALGNIQHPARRYRLHLDTKQIQSLQEKLQVLIGFLELPSQRESQELEDLARQITAIVHEAEGVVDLHVVYQLGEGSQDKGKDTAALLSFYQDIENVNEKIDSITQVMMMVKGKWANDGVQERQAVASVRRSSSTILASGGKNGTPVGFEKRLERVMEELAGYESKLRIITVAGMGGIGKTTLAQNIFEHHYIIQHFDLRAWCTISQLYNVTEVLLGLLCDIQDGNEIEGNLALCSANQLGERLYKSLSGKRYFIVMDDVCSTEIWDDVKSFFPDNRSGSRILVTTRMSKVAVSLGSRRPYLMDFLDENKSWDLFCEKVFGKQSCPFPELEKIGKNITKSCRGLPLAIVIIGGLLANSNMTREYWEFVGENVSSYANLGNDEHCLKILSLSYNNLPIHLKSCFLSMRKISQGRRIGPLIKYWVAEGFLKPTGGKNMEEVANEYLKDLIDRNLILVRALDVRGNIHACEIHDLLGDLCMRESEKEQYFLVQKAQIVNLQMENIEGLCFLCGHGSAFQMINFPKVHIASRSTSVTSALVCNNCRHMHQYLARLRLVKMKYFIGSYTVEHLHPTNLRLLHVRSGTSLELLLQSKLFFLWDLRSLDIYGAPVLPFEIWDMAQLRYLMVDSAIIPNLVVTPDFIVLEKLHTLCKIRNFKCTEEVLQKIPNLKKLKCHYDEKKSMEWSYYRLYNLARLNKLEPLSVDAKDMPLKNISFPTSLKELKLTRCNISWEEMTIIGASLPILETLILRTNAFKGYAWDPIEGQFLRLKVLSIDNSDLVRRGAEHNHFPNLERLFLKRMHWLKEIPLSVGDIATLVMIYLRDCGDSVLNSAKQILEEQDSLGMRPFKFMLIGKS